VVRACAGVRALEWTCTRKGVLCVVCVLCGSPVYWILRLGFFYGSVTSTRRARAMCARNVRAQCARNREMEIDRSIDR
jgi:hypothetical protein